MRFRADLEIYLDIRRPPVTMFPRRGIRDTTCTHEATLSRLRTTLSGLESNLVSTRRSVGVDVGLDIGRERLLDNE